MAAAPGVISQEWYTEGNIRKVVFTCAASVDDASFPDTVLSKGISGRLLSLATNPGTPAPQANYDVAINDQHGHDVLETVGQNRHTSDTEKVAVVYSGTGTHPVVHKNDTLTLAISNNNVNSAVTVITLYFALGG